MIVLYDGYHIDVDRCNYTLRCDYGVNDKGQIKRRVIGYYTSLAEALKAFGRELVRAKLKNGDMSLREALTTIVESNKELENFINENIPDNT